MASWIFSVSIIVRIEVIEVITQKQEITQLTLQWTSKYRLLLGTQELFKGQSFILILEEIPCLFIFLQFENKQLDELFFMTTSSV